VQKKYDLDFFKKEFSVVADKVGARLDMDGLIGQAYDSFQQFVKPSKLPFEDTLPFIMFHGAKGAVFLTVLKGGVIFGGSIGTGIIMYRLANGGWSAPCAIGLAGVNWGLQIGAAKTDHVIALRDQHALDTFIGKGQLSLGGDASIALATEGRSANASLSLNEKGEAAGILSYSHAKGIYAGISLEGQLILVRDDCNEKFYGKKISPKDILSSSKSIPNDKEKTWSELCELLNSASDEKNYKGAEEDK